MAQQPSGTMYFANAARTITQAKPRDETLGPLCLLPGTWANVHDPEHPDKGPFHGRGWNMIALPFSTGDQGPNYRLLMNQYNERLIITTKDEGVPNRGIEPNPPQGSPTVETDQELVALDYEQGVVHIATEDSPSSGLKQPLGAAIHHEPGLFLFMKSQTQNGIDIARLGTVPHGNSLLALGASTPTIDGPPVIPDFNGLPIGLGNADPEVSPYLRPYQHFIQNPFLGLFRPDQTHALLVASVSSLGPVRKTTTLTFSTKLEKAGIVNIPFIEHQADATEMDVTFWILELEELGTDGKPRLIMLYHQVVMLDFFPGTDGVHKLVKWPHVSINTMERIPEETPPAPLKMSDVTNEAIA